METMYDTVTFYKAQAEADTREYQQWFLKSHAPTLINVGGAKRCVVNLIEPEPEKLPYRPSDELKTPDGKPAYDVVLEVSSIDHASYENLRRSFAILPKKTSLCHAYRVDRSLEKDELGEQPIGEATPGLKFISKINWWKDMQPSAARRSWDNHVALALRVHIGASKYLRNWVTSKLTDSAPDTGGVTMLNFLSQYDLENRWFDSARGEQEIMHDKEHFVSGGNRLYAKEYLLFEPDRGKARPIQTQRDGWRPWI